MESHEFMYREVVPSGWQNLFLEMCEEKRQKLTGMENSLRSDFLRSRKSKVDFGWLPQAATVRRMPQLTGVKGAAKVYA